MRIAKISASDTYDRWYATYNHGIINLKGAIERLSNDQGKAFDILNKHLNLLTDMRYVYTQADTVQKREFVCMVFDNNLYYQEGIYRTPTMMDMFVHNPLLMKEKGYLIKDILGLVAIHHYPEEKFILLHFQHCK